MSASDPIADIPADNPSPKSSLDREQLSFDDRAARANDWRPALVLCPDESCEVIGPTLDNGRARFCEALAYIGLGERVFEFSSEAQHNLRRKSRGTDQALPTGGFKLRIAGLAHRRHARNFRMPLGHRDRQPLQIATFHLRPEHRKNVNENTFQNASALRLRFATA